MNATTLMSAIVRSEIRLAQASLAAIDHQLLHRLGGRAAGARSAVRRLRSVVDGLAGENQQAPPARDRDSGSAVLDRQELREVEQLAEAYLEEEDQHLTGELAEDEQLRRVQAELRAKHTIQEQDELSRKQ